MMDAPNAQHSCIVTGCGKPSRGNFCMDCWALLPWDIKGAMGRARKKNHSTKDATAHAKQYLENQRGTAAP